MGKIVIVGAGIIGLYTALLLTEAGIGHDVVILAKNIPGDFSIDYTSPVAGAHFSFDVAGDSPELLDYCRVSYKLLKSLFEKFVGLHEVAGLGRLSQVELSETAPSSEFITSIKDVADNFEIITDKPWLKQKGASFGMRYDTFNFNSPKFLIFLKKYLESKGVVLVRCTLKSIADAPHAAGVQKVSAIFNCSGALVSKLDDVKDANSVYPIRGQVVTVLAPWIHENIGIKRAGIPPTYIIPRPYSGGHVILGGYYDKYDDTESTIAEQTASIITRTTKLNPDLLRNGPLNIIGERAGLRPGREGGPRVEKDVISGYTVIHNYGAAGTGYQCGLGMVSKAIDLYFGSTEHCARL